MVRVGLSASAVSVSVTGVRIGDLAWVEVSGFWVEGILRILRT